MADKEPASAGFLLSVFFACRLVDDCRAICRELRLQRVTSGCRSRCMTELAREDGTALHQTTPRALIPEQARSYRSCHGHCIYRRGGGGKP